MQRPCFSNKLAVTLDIKASASGNEAAYFRWRKHKCKKTYSKTSFSTFSVAKSVNHLFKQFSFWQKRSQVSLSLFLCGGDAHSPNTRDVESDASATRCSVGDAAAPTGAARCEPSALARCSAAAARWFGSDWSFISVEGRSVISECAIRVRCQSALKECIGLGVLL